jgi:F-type H+-transporting ATPase subunit alpha
MAISKVALLLAVSQGVLDDVPLDRVGSFRGGLGACLAECCPEALAIDDRMTALSGELKGRLTAALAGLARSLGSAS